MAESLRGIEADLKTAFRVKTDPHRAPSTTKKWSTYLYALGCQCARVEKVRNLLVAEMAWALAEGRQKSKVARNKTTYDVRRLTRSVSYVFSTSKWYMQPLPLVESLSVHSIFSDGGKIYMKRWTCTSFKISAFKSPTRIISTCCVHVWRQ